MTYNPYFNRSVIQDPAAFFGRQRIVRKVYASVAQQQCIALTGIRRIGKSSLLAYLCQSQVQHQFQQFDLSKQVFVPMSFADHGQTDPIAFLTFVAQQLILKCRGLGTTASLEVHGKDLSSYTEAFGALLDQVNEEGFRPVLLMDEFDIVTQNPRLDKSFFYFLRSQAADWHRITYVTASVAPLHRLCHSGIIGSPFFNIFHSDRLGSLDFDEAKELIATPAKASGCTFTEDEVELVLDMAGRHPFFIQCACFELFDEKVRGHAESEPLGLDYSALQSRVYSQLLPHFEYYWAHLDESERQELLTDVHRSVASQRLIPELSESGLFLRFVRNSLGITFAPTGIVATDLKSALKRLTDFRYLGESKFAYLRTVSQRCPPSATSYERGIAVASVLREAIERLQPKGPHSNVAPEWRPFNVVHYGYVVRGGMSVDDIARRLAIGRRTFYRERDEALDAVLSRLAEMETLPIQSH